MDANSIDIFNHNSVSCKIDKFRLHGHALTDVLNDDIEQIVVDNVRNARYKYFYEHTYSDRPNGYCRLHNISYYEHYDNGTKERFTIAIFVGFNGPNACGTEEEQRRFVLEFNPQKFKVPTWLRAYFQKKFFMVEYINDIDLAIDFRGFERSRFRYILNNGNTITTSTGTANNKTDYIGKDKHNNRVKIYDKKKERSKYIEMEEETTRVEITLRYVHRFYFKSVQGEEMKFLLAAADVLSQVFILGEDCKDPFVYALNCLSQEELNCAMALMSAPTKRRYRKLMKDSAQYTVLCDATELLFYLDRHLKSILTTSGIYYEHKTF